MTPPPTDAIHPPLGLSRYAALAASLRQRVVSGAWPAGGALPSEQALAAAHGVALGTLRRALDLLADEGVVERVHGRGTFVRQALGGAPMLRFFRFGRGEGEAPQSRIRARSIDVPPAEVAQALGCPPGERALRLKRLRSLGGQPVLHEEIWLPLPRFAALAESDPATWGDLLYPLFAERCGVSVHRAVDAISFGTLGAEHARALRLPAGHPCARVQRLAHDLAGRCVEWRTSLGDALAFHYTVSIH